jgi:7-keto-8-aminopelargonate synthetase-like enzyme
MLSKRELRDLAALTKAKGCYLLVDETFAICRTEWTGIDFWMN